MTMSEFKYDNTVKARHKGCELSQAELKERELLLQLQGDHTRWFSQEEFDRLKELSRRKFESGGHWSEDVETLNNKNNE
jgi:hypothetical protein